MRDSLGHAITPPAAPLAGGGRLPLGLSRQHLPLLSTVGVCLLLYLVAGLTSRGFFSLGAFIDLINNNAFLGVAAVGLTFVILSGGIDLSVGSAMACTTILLATLVEGKFSSGLPPVHPLLAIALVLVAGLAFGAAMGALIHFFALPPFLVTLGGLFFCRGVGLLVSRASMEITHPFYKAMAGWEVEIPGRLTHPLPALLFLAVLAAAAYLGRYTAFGRNCYAIGGSEASARLMGLPVGRAKVLIYAAGGLCSALAGVVLTIATPAGNASGNQGLELDAIAAVVIGGTFLSGGSGSLLGTFVGVVILAIITQYMNFQGIRDPSWARIVMAVLLLAFILLQKLIQRKGR